MCVLCLQTMRMVLRNSRRVSVLKSDLCTIFHQGVLDSSQKVLPRDLSGADVLGENTEMKCNPPSASALGSVWYMIGAGMAIPSK